MMMPHLDDSPLTRAGLALFVAGLAAGCGSSAPTLAWDAGSTPDDRADAHTRAIDTNALGAALDDVATAAIDPRGADGRAVGLVVAIVTPELAWVRGYGRTRIEDGGVPRADTLFELGSITKVMTGALLADAVLRGELHLDDEVEALLPDSVVVPRWGSRAITLLDLATHTSGLPVMPDNLTGTPPNPAAGYSPAQLYEFLARHTLATEPGTTFVYSNLGFGLLGHALVTARGASSYDAMIDALFGAQLGMHDTHVAQHPEDAARTATGHRQGRTVPPNRIDTLEGGGALRSTGDDMVRFLRSALGLDAALQPVFEEVERPRRSAPRGPIGLGLQHSDDATLGLVYEKAGGTAGFSSHVAWIDGRRVGVAILANTSGFDAATLARAVLAIFVGGAS